MSGRCGSISSARISRSSASAPSTSAGVRVEVALQDRDRRIERAAKRLRLRAQRGRARDLELDLDLPAAELALGGGQRLRDGLVAPLDAHEAEQRALDRDPEPLEAGLRLVLRRVRARRVVRGQVRAHRQLAARAPRAGRG